MTKLEHVKLSRVDAGIDPRTDLAKEAGSLLEYSKLSEAITSGTLASTLVRLDIAPLNRVSVEQYKAKKSKPGMWSHTKDGLTCTCVFIVLAAPFSVLLNRSFVWSGSSGVLAVIGCAVCGILAAVTAIGACVSFFDGAGGSVRVLREWRMLAMEGYNAAIPEFVLSKAVQIKRELPAVTFKVEQLFESYERTAVRQPDPFLVAQLGSETFYIDVWDEKEYEATL